MSELVFPLCSLWDQSIFVFRSRWCRFAQPPANGSRPLRDEFRWKKDVPGRSLGRATSPGTSLQLLPRTPFRFTARAGYAGYESCRPLGMGWACQRRWQTQHLATVLMTIRERNLPYSDNTKTNKVVTGRWHVIATVNCGSISTSHRRVCIWSNSFTACVPRSQPHARHLRR